MPHSCCMPLACISSFLASYASIYASLPPLPTQDLDVPSPTFLLCLSYKEDLGHDPQARSSSGSSATAPTVHHMDPYRLGSKMDKMSGLIDWDAAFRDDICLIEWPDKMPPGGRLMLGGQAYQ